MGEIQCSESESECSPSSVSAWLITIFITDVYKYYNNITLVIIIFIIIVIIVVLSLLIVVM